MTTCPAPRPRLSRKTKPATLPPELPAHPPGTPPPTIRREAEWVSGHRQFTSPPLAHSAKTILFAYYGWELWVPAKAVVVYPDGTYSAAAWAIDWAKERCEN